MLFCNLLSWILYLNMKKTCSKFCVFIEIDYLCIAFEGQRHWRGGRVVDRGGLENRWLSQVRGFESLPLRWTNRTLPDKEQPSPTNSTICGTFLSPYVCPGHHLEERTGNPDRSTDTRVTWSDCFYKILISKMIPNVRRQKTSVS